MKIFNAIIVDDEEAARDLLHDLIADHIHEVKVIGQASSADEADDLITHLVPDIVFLDIDMPGKNGFEVARSIGLRQIQAAIVFVTAYNQYAIDAIRCSAFDYLLKPVAVSQLKSCIERLKASGRQNDLLGSVNQLLMKIKPEKISFSSRSGNIFIDPRSITYCEAEGNYTDIYFVDGIRETVSHNLGYVENAFCANGFIRISRSMIINKLYLHKINRKEKKCILHAGGREFSLSIKGSYLKNEL